MKKIFTLICLAVMALSVSAKDVTINCAGATLPITQDGVTIAAGENASTVASGIKLAKGTATLIISAEDNITKIAVSANNISTSGEGWDAAGNWAGEAKSVTLTNNSTAIAGTTITTIVVTIEDGGTPSGKPEKYVAISWDGTAYTVSAEFAAVVADPTKGGVATNAEDGASIVKFGTENIEAEAVDGAVASNVDGAVTAEGVQIWGDIKWEWKNQGDILFAYINGTGNPVFGYDIEEIMTDGVGTGKYRQKFEGYYYTPDCGEMPAQGLYYKFTAKKAGDLKIYVWANKNRKTYLVDEATAEPVKYAAEGYINGQNYPGDYEDATLAGKKKWLTSEEIQALHDASGNAGNPYIIGAGNQPFWGVINYTMTAGQSVWLFHDSAQIGFQGYEFTPSSTTGIENVTTVNANAVAVRKMMQNGKLVIVNGASEFNVAGQRMK